MASIPPALTTWKRLLPRRPCLDPGTRALPGPHYVQPLQADVFQTGTETVRVLVLDEDRAEDLPRFWTLSTLCKLNQKTQDERSAQDMLGLWDK